MSDQNVLKSELAVHGIRVNSGQFSYFLDGHEKTLSWQEICNNLKQDIKKNRLILSQLWDELLGSLTVVPSSLVEGSVVTQRLFIHSIKQILRLTQKFKELAEAKPLLKNILTSDIKRFSEKYMSKVVEYTLCMNWVYKAVRYDDFRLYLLEKFNLSVDKKASYEDEENFGNPGYSGNVHVPMSDRVFSYEELERDNKDFENTPTWQSWKRRYNAHRDADWEDGFYTEDKVYRLRNNPYLYEDSSEESNVNSNTNLSRKA